MQCVHPFGPDGLGEASREARGVGAAGHHDHPRGVAVNQAAASHCLGETVKGLLSSHSGDLKATLGATRRTCR
jgi:hypothetical protein